MKDAIKAKITQPTLAETPAPRTSAPTDPAKVLKTEQIRKAKSLVINMEKENFSHLILWRSSNSWWKMCQHSALIYSYYIAPKVLLRLDSVDLRTDTDHYYYAADGVTSIPNIDKFTAILKEHGIKLSKITDDNIRIFNLPKEHHFTREDIEKYRIAERGRYDKLNVMFRVQDIYPAVSTELNKAVGATIQLVNKLNERHFEFIGRRIYDELLNAHEAYLDIEHGHLDAKPGLEKVVFHTEHVLNNLHLVSEGRMAPVNRLSDAARHNYNLMTEAKGILTKIAKAEAAHQ